MSRAIDADKTISNMKTNAQNFVSLMVAASRHVNPSLPTLEELEESAQKENRGFFAWVGGLFGRSGASAAP